MREREREENGFQRRRSDDHFKRSTKFKRPGISNLDQHLEKKKKKNWQQTMEKETSYFRIKKSSQGDRKKRRNEWNGDGDEIGKFRIA